ncbi:hypothetical protein IWX76_002070 [Pedobacter sp. CAN_A7]|uniref:hypothetical protein n=1 Tax=Pedobacter sp. CAN_A7 TaxID=2787722 RepID=UPI001A1FA6DA
MKRNIFTAAVALGLLTAFTAPSVIAQEKKETVGQKLDKTTNKVGKTATKVGNKTAEVAVKGTSKIADKTWKGKMAPNGSDVYINNKNQKYYINEKGARIYLKPSQIRTKVD